MFSFLLFSIDDGLPSRLSTSTFASLHVLISTPTP
ncbi:hypothetical protein SOVF_158640 [Spinacia oleracea]|nr:hypothetical protein SOVF_158640 [Spinacia oleracea]